MRLITYTVLICTIPLVGVFISVWMVSGLSEDRSLGVITKPLADINKNINRMVSNIGSSDITYGLTDVHSGLGIEEQELAGGYNGMVDYLKKSQMDAGVEDNKYYNSCPYAQQPVSMSKDGVFPPLYQNMKFLKL